MKRLIAILAALMMLVMSAAAGENTTGSNADSDFTIEGTTVVKYNGPGGEVTVPDGVTALGELAFTMTKATKVILPDTLTEIKNHCFYSCPGLSEITIPAGVTKIGEAQAFAFNPNLQEIRVAEGNTSFTSVDGVLFTADKEKMLFYPSGKETAIYSIPEGTEALGSAIFSDPAGLTTLVIPASIGSELMGPQFSSCAHLKNIIVSPDNKRYHSINGILYDHNNSLVYYPSGRTAEDLGKDDFPEEMTEVKSWAFQHAHNLKTVELPDSVTSIGWMCFTRAEALESITVPASVKTIDGFAFADCNQLKRVTILNPDVVFVQEDKNILKDSPEAVLYGYEDSTTQAYAEKYALKFKSLGAAPGKAEKPADNTAAADAADDQTEEKKAVTEIAASDDFQIEGTTLVKYKGAGGEVTVPDGVTKLGENAFEGSAVTKVNLPETLKEIRSYCFGWCYYLEEVTLPASLEELEYYYEGSEQITQAQVFAFNPKLKAINVAEGNTHYQSVDGVLFSADGKKLLYYPDGKTEETYAIPEGTTEIGYSAFGEAAKLQTIEIPSTLVQLHSDGGDFSCIPNLKAINVSSDNKYYFSADGVMYRDEYSLVFYPNGKEGENLGKDDFLKGTSSIGAFAFQGNRNLKTIELPEGITDLGWSSFDCMQSLESIIVPASVRNISGYAFSDCRNLEKVTILSLNTWFYEEDNSILEGSSKAVLCGYEGSTTQAYAEKHKLKFESLGVAPGKEEKPAENAAESITVPDAAENSDVHQAEKEETAPAVTANADFEIAGTTLVRYKGNGGEVTVPEGVTKLGEWAFEDAKVTKVNLPESLEEIENYCFFNCNNLTEVTIPAGVTAISESQAFAYCRSLQEIRVAEGNTAYVSVDGVLFTANKEVLMYYPDGKDADAYFIPEGTIRLGSAAFSEPQKLTAVVIPSTLTGLDEDNDFSGSPRLNMVIVSPENRNYYTYNGVLYNKHNTLVYYPSGKNAENLGKNDFPKGVVRLGPWAFQEAQHLKNVELPDGLTNIGWMCFTFDESLESVTVPASVNMIGGYAFADCKNLKRITILNPNTAFEQEGSVIVDSSPKAVLYGYEGSTTQAYAEKHGLKFESLGAAPGKEEKTAAADNSVAADTAENQTEGKKAAAGIIAGADFEIEGTTLVKYKGPGGKVTVPEGVTVLGTEAFDSSEVTKVILPESLEKIEHHCFFGCKELKEITIPAGVTSISEGQVFAYNDKLQTIRVAEGNSNYVSKDGVLFTADMKTLLYYPNGKVANTYSIPEGTERLGDTAFSGPDHLEIVMIPSTLRGIEQSSQFDSCVNLHTIIVAKGNKDYYTFNDALYSNSNELITYPAGKLAASLGKANFPQDIKSIGNWAFMGDQNLKEIELPDGVVSVGWMSFDSMRSVESITLPASVERIEGAAFENCPNLKQVTILNPDVEFVKFARGCLSWSREAVLYGYEGSTTQAYAEEWNIKFESLGAAPGKAE